MGKAHKREKNKLKHEGVLEDKQKPHRGSCSIVGCDQRGGEIIHCRTCEALVVAGKRKPENVYSVQHCAIHAEQARAKAKTHALLSHPYNLIRVTMAALKGEL